MRVPLLRALGLVAALALTGCGDDPVIPTGVANAVIQLSSVPNPIVTVVTSGNTFVVRWTTKVTELNGLGATFELVECRLFDDVTGVPLAVNIFDDKDLVVFVGSKRVEPRSFLDIPQELSYVAATKRAASLIARVRLKDDRGNTLEQALLVKVN